MWEKAGKSALGHFAKDRGRAVWTCAPPRDVRCRTKVDTSETINEVPAGDYWNEEYSQTDVQQLLITFERYWKWPNCWKAGTILHNYILCVKKCMNLFLAWDCLILAGASLTCRFACEGHGWRISMFLLGREKCVSTKWTHEKVGGCRTLCKAPDPRQDDESGNAADERWCFPHQPAATLFRIYNISGPNLN